MIDKKIISKNITIIEQMTQNGASPSLDDYFDEIVDILSRNIDETMDYLDNCKKQELEWISPYFEDMAYNFQSKDFIMFLEELEKKHQDIDMKIDIESARDSIIN
ncbi:hypothetical protein [Vallitalea sp.]|uniref:hypothetical protein n=1 Tax=Vallitalea sp. TaxID=1882829 RepID=UPI0025EDF334|nr:hypothetical protein [Vallitalea sp.]MCT4686074.1 hypothetical protein [Vallitalea sp.]